MVKRESRLKRRLPPKLAALPSTNGLRRQGLPAVWRSQHDRLLLTASYREQPGLSPLWNLLGAPTAIDQNIRPGNESGVFRAQVERKLANLFDFSPAS